MRVFPWVCQKSRDKRNEKIRKEKLIMKMSSILQAYKKSHDKKRSYDRVKRGF